MADLVLDYALLYKLAINLRELKAKVKTDVETGSRRAVVASDLTVVSNEQMGHPLAYTSLSGFFSVCHSPFKDSMELLDKLADTFDQIAKTFFDMDADLAGKANTARLQSQVSAWNGQKEAYERYERLKDKSVTYQYYDQNGHLQTGSIPVWNGPAPEKPADTPDSDIDFTADKDTGDTGTTTTTATVDPEGRIQTETTTVKSDTGLSYTETTTYKYVDTDGDGKIDVVDYTTTIGHSDGKSETIAKTTGSDGTVVVTSTTSEGVTTSTITATADGGSREVKVDPDGVETTTDIVVNADGTGTKTVVGPDGTDVYTGDPKTSQWTLQSHEDPDEDPYNEQYF